MQIKYFEKIDRRHLFTALFVWFVSLGVYIKTLAPTLSFWDCGEFIATSYIFGIPHPPGAPVYLLFGRVFSLIPFFSDIAARINLVSAICSSFTALFCYLCGVRILRYWFEGSRRPFDLLLIYGGSASGALLAAFGLTNWNNSVEAEVYGLSMMLFMAILWLTLKYLDQADSAMSQKFMLTVFYLAFLGIGVHMATFLALPIVALAFIMKRDTPAQIWFVLASFVAFELYLIFVLSSRPGEIPYFVPVMIVFVVYLFFVFSFEQIRGLYLLVVGGFAIALAPVYGKIYGLASAALKGGSVITGSTSDLLNAIGSTAFVVLILFAFFSLARYTSHKKSHKKASHHLHVAVFILAAAVMVGLALLDQIKGYVPFLVLSGVLSAILAIIVHRYLNWPVLIATLGTLLIVLGVWQYFYASLVVIAALLILGLLFKIRGWKTALMITAVAAIGFSSHLIIPIRSAHQPAINENNPSSSLQATINFLERKQYGSQSMVVRMFKRRAEWVNQFGDFMRMGFWHYFSRQYGMSGSLFILPFLLGVFGIWEVVRRKPARGVILLLLVLIASVGLVLYMNFADGTRRHPLSGADYLEVRDRDYFFTPAFILFGLSIGLGIAATVHYVRDSVAKYPTPIRKIAVGAASLLLLLPVVTVARNYHYCDRTGNYLPYDYAWNLLTSADQNAVLFTSGDNDTFPLWCIQQVYGVRKDVRVLNLSLANTKWYIKQIEPNLGLKFDLSNEEIDRLRPFRTRGGAVFKVQDQVLDVIMRDNFGEVPINFSVTVGAEARRHRGRSIDSILSFSGMTWRVNDSVRHMGVDIEESLNFYTDPDKFKARNINNPDVYLDETSKRLSRNLANGFLVVADALRREKAYDRAEYLALRARRLIPHATDQIGFLAQVYSEQNKIEQLQSLVDTCRLEDKVPLRLLAAQTYRRIGNDARAGEELNKILAENPSNRKAFDELMRLYLNAGRLNAVRSGIDRWLQYNPNDQQIRQLSRQLEQSLEESGTLDSGR